MDHVNQRELRTSENRIAEKAFRILLVLIWTQNTIFQYVRVVLMSLPLFNLIADHALTICIVVSALFALPWITERIRGGDVFFYCICVMIVVGSLVFFKSNAPHIKSDLWRMLGTVFPMYFIGVSYSHETCKKDLFYASVVGVLVSLMYQFFLYSSGRTTGDYNMNAAYNVLPSALYVLYYAFERAKFRYWAVAVMGIVLVLMFGTRGPILILMVFAAYEFLSVVKNAKSAFVKVVTVLMIALVLFFVFSEGYMIKAAEYMSELFGKLGFSTRIFDYFLEGEMTTSVGRENIAETLYQALAEKPLSGYGLMGDRIFVDSYAHKIYLELWVHFGVIFGTLILGFFVLVPVRAIFRSKDVEERDFVVMMFCAVFVKLMLSGSYLYEQNLYLLLGMSFTMIRVRKSERLMN